MNIRKDYNKIKKSTIRNYKFFIHHLYPFPITKFPEKKQIQNIMRDKLIKYNQKYFYNIIPLDDFIVGNFIKSWPDSNGKRTEAEFFTFENFHTKEYYNEDQFMEYLEELYEPISIKHKIERIRGIAK